MTIKYSIIFPCFNEGSNIPILLNKCNKIRKENIEFIFIDNGSNDHSVKYFKNAKKKYPHFKFFRIKNNIGYGFGIHYGLKKAKGQIIGWTHSDLQADVNDLINAISIIEKSKESFIFLKGKRINRPFIDSFFSMSMGLIASVVFLKKLIEINAQPTFFSRNLFDDANDIPNDFSIDLYFYNLALIKKYKLIRFDVNFINRIYGNSSWNKGIFSKVKFILRNLFNIYLIKKNYDNN